MRNLISYFPSSYLIEGVTSIFKSSKNVVFSGVVNASSKGLVAADIFRDQGDSIGNTLWITSDKSEMLLIDQALRTWSDRKVFIYSQMMDDQVINYANISEFRRVKRVGVIELVLRIKLCKNAIFIIDFDSLLQNYPSLKEIERAKFSLKKGENIDSVKIIQKLVSMGYEMGEPESLSKGSYYRVGDSILLHPINSELPLRIEVGFENVEKMFTVQDDDYSINVDEVKNLDIYPLDYEEESSDLVSLFEGDGMVVDDEVDVSDDYYKVWNEFMDEAEEKCKTISFSSFNDDVKNHRHLHYISILKYRNAYDLANDFRDKISANWKVLMFTKNVSEIRGLLVDQAIPFVEGVDKERLKSSSVFIVNVQKDDIFPQSFQNPEQKVMLLSDVDLSFLREDKKKKVVSGDSAVFADFLMGLKNGDYVVHVDHGIAKFLGLEKKTVDNITREYLKLGYAENDKLFVPIDQADKVNKYIGSDELMPKLTRLGSAEWNTVTSKVKKETQKIAKELLKLYAERRAAKGFKFPSDDKEQLMFEEKFPYEETPGQMKAILDVKKDMESDGVMDRLVCGDVGFGKTEVAIRAAFKAVRAGKQVAIISPITILADQHYKSFDKRMQEFNIRVEMLSRFRTAREQVEIVKKLSKGEIDIIIGTHRLIQKDIKFKDLGLVVIDEEQRFGVQQKEKLKEMRKEVDILTLTATPIPRTLNICLNKLRDVTTITTPPYGRLPVITEVRKYSSSLVREVILREVQRGGQVYFLHNRVQTIDGFAEKMRSLVPEAKFVVAHGKLGSGDLEERILAFTEGKYDVLVSSTIIENGIDLANANTLIVDGAERFGLAQLYQLRGRVGRGKAQAYAYFLYNGQRLKLDAKKRLRAIVEASKLGSGFEIAMKDLEIRGAGDILGVNQHGVINVVGVAHFVRMLNRAVEDLKAGRVTEDGEEIADVAIELPVPAYIPDLYIASSNDKINAYQKLSGADTLEYLEEIKEDLVEEYGKVPVELENLFKVIALKIWCKKAGLLSVKAGAVPMSKDKEIVMVMSKSVKPANIVNLLEFNPKWVISGTWLKINMRDLGVGWFDAVLEGVERLTMVAEPGKVR